MSGHEESPGAGQETPPRSGQDVAVRALAATALAAASPEPGTNDSED